MSNLKEAAQHVAPSIEAARAMGAKGGPAVEAERLAFEAWMAGHCWALCAIWDGQSYRGSAESNMYIDPRAMNTRQLWAAWRDRATLAQHDDNAQPVAEVYRGHYGGRNGDVGFDGVRPLRGAKLPPPGTKLYTTPQPPEEQGNKLLDALYEIAGSKSLTATPTQFYQHLQRIAKKAVNEYAMRAPEEHGAELSDDFLCKEARLVLGRVPAERHRIALLSLMRIIITTDRAMRVGAA